MVDVIVMVLAHYLHAETLNRIRFSKKSLSQVEWSLRAALLGKTKDSQVHSPELSSNKV